MEHIRGIRLLRFVKQVIAVKKQTMQKEKTKQFLMPHLEAVREHVESDTVKMHLQQLEQKINMLVEQEQMAFKKQHEETDLLFKLQEKMQQMHFEEKIKPFCDFEKISVKIDETKQDVAAVKQTITKLEQQETRKDLAAARVQELEEKIAEKTRIKKEEIQEMGKQLASLEGQLAEQEKNAPKAHIKKIKSRIQTYKKQLEKIKEKN